MTKGDWDQNVHCQCTRHELEGKNGARRFGVGINTAVFRLFDIGGLVFVFPK